MAKENQDSQSLPRNKYQANPPLYTTFQNVKESLQDPKNSDKSFPLIISNKKDQNKIFYSGFYDGKYKIATTYVNSIFDFYNKKEIEKYCLKNINTKNTEIKISFSEDLNLNTINLVNTKKQKKIISTPCFSVTQYGSVSLKLTRPLINKMIKGHIPVHQFEKDNYIYYVMLSENSGDLYYIKKAKTDSRDSSKNGAKYSPGKFYVIALNKEFISKRVKYGEDNIFQRVESLKNGIRVHTRNGYVLEITNTSIVNAESIGTAHAEAFVFNEWKARARAGEKPFFLAASYEKIDYRKFPTDSGVQLIELKVEGITDRIHSEFLSKNSFKPFNNNDKKNIINPQRAYQIISEKLIELCRKFEQEFQQEVPEIIKVSFVTGEKKHSILNFFSDMDFWYSYHENKLLAANTNDGFRIVGYHNNFMALKKDTPSIPYQFDLQIAYNRKNKKNTDYSDSLFPKPFNKNIILPSPYSDTAPKAEYSWNDSKQQWDGRLGNTLFSITKEEKLITGFDYITPLINSKDIKYWPLQIIAEYKKFNNTSFSELRDKLAEKFTELAGKKTKRLLFYPKKTLLSIEFPFESIFSYLTKTNDKSETIHFTRGWFDTKQQRYFPGPKSQSGDELILFASLGSKSESGRYAVGWCYNKTTKKLYQIQKEKIKESGNFDSIEISNDGKKITLLSTAGNDIIVPSKINMDTIYADDGKISYSLNNDFTKPNDLSIYLDGHGGVDTFVIDQNDLKYYLEVIIKLNSKELNQKNNIDQCMQLIRINSNSFLYKAMREGNDLVLINRFDSAGLLRIKNIWTQKNDLLPKSTIIEFNDINFLSDSLRNKVDMSGGEYRLPLIVNKMHQLDSSYSISASAKEPLLIELGPEFQAIPHKNRNGITINLQHIKSEPLKTDDSTNDKKPKTVKVKISGYKFASGSVQIKQLSTKKTASTYYNGESNENYHFLQFDDSKNCHLCLEEVRLSRTQAFFKGYNFIASNKPSEIKSPNLKYVATWKNNAGYPLITRSQINSGLPLDISNHYPQVVLNNPLKHKKQNVFSVFNNINDFRAIRFNFSTDISIRRLNWSAYYGRVLTRKGTILRDQNSALNILLAESKSKNDYSIPYYQILKYKIFPFGLDDLKLTKNDEGWSFGTTFYSYPIGAINENQKEFAHIISPIHSALLATLPGYQFVFSGQNSQRTVSSWELATILEHSAPRIIDSLKHTEKASILQGNNLNNIIYVDAESKPAQVLGMEGNDLILIRGTEQVTNPILNGGQGDEIYDLMASRKVSVVDREGDHHVLLSSASRANLRGLGGKKSTTLFLTDLTESQVTFTLYDKITGKSIPLTYGAKSTPTNISMQDTVVSIIDTRSNQPLAQVLLASLNSIYFKGGKVTHNPAAWITQGSESLLLEDSDKAVGALSYVDNMVNTGSLLIGNLQTDSKPEKGTQLESASATSSPSVENSLNSQYLTLIQGIASLSGDQHAGSPVYTPTPHNQAALNITSPLASGT